MKYLTLVLLAVLAWPAWTHPVIYKGGTSIMSVVRPQMSRFEVNHTLLRNVAVGMTYRRFSLLDRELESTFFQTNVLAKRWNLEGSQANIYLMGGIGHGTDSIGKNGLSLYGGFQADWENRKYYAALKAEGLNSPDKTARLLRGRIGLAPYESKFDELQNWFMIQFDYTPEMQTQFSVTPLFRFFYRSALWEFGSSLKGNWFLQLMLHI